MAVLARSAKGSLRLREMVRRSPLMPYPKMVHIPFEKYLWFHSRQSWTERTSARRSISKMNTKDSVATWTKETFS